MCAILQVQTSRFIHLQPKTEVFSIASCIENFISLLLLRHHFRYCYCSTWQQRRTQPKLLRRVSRAGSFASNHRIHCPVKTESLCALVLLWLHMWKVFDFQLALSAIFSEWMLYLITRALVLECASGLVRCAVAVGSASDSASLKTFQRRPLILTLSSVCTVCLKHPPAALRGCD